jgi:signal transduction histidine kinase
MQTTLKRLQRQKMEAVGQLTCGIAHDFKNLLTIISGNLEMLALDKAQSAREQRILVGEAWRVTDIMAQLATNLLAFARREQIDCAPTDIGDLASSTTRFLTRILGEGVGLQIEAGAGLKAKINPAQFQTALINLAINARDAMPDGGRINVLVEKALVDAEQAREMQVEPGPYVTISVADTGQGMTKEVLGRAFDAFYTTKPTGTGLGLAVVREFAVAAGGTVTIRSEPGMGTIVELWIPLDEGEAAAKGKNCPSLVP